MRRIIVFTGPQGSGKSTQAKRLANLLYSLPDITTTQAHAQDYTRGLLEMYVKWKGIIILEDAEGPDDIVKLADLVDEIKTDLQLNVDMIFTSQADCSKLDRTRFRVVLCEYSTSQEEYLVKPYHG